MSEAKKISPLLDGFSVGNPISDHNGVVCCPAIKENTDKKYILKIISIPATQAQLDALLLAGAYKDPADAMEYYRRMCEDILQEAELLKTLSKLEGFLPYDGWQMEPITRRRLGYEIYLIGSYKRSLEKYIRKNAITHLEAVNLGLDLCSALSVCRQAGFLYVALKPGNIYVSDKKEYRIGDLGFLSLDSLRYASLPERYHGPYVPPELLDPMNVMNLTVDTYAVGMILYQLYNDGHLPFSGNAPTEALASPANADYEMAEIIMKAIHPDPEQRWDDPKELGKALASYMQRNSINDVPITAFTPIEVKPEDIVVIPKKQEAEVPEVVISVQETSDAEEILVTMGEESTVETPDEQAEIEAHDENNVSFPLEDQETDVYELPESVCEAAEVPADAVEELPEETNEPESPVDIVLTEEVSKIVAKADDLIAHEIPEEAVFPTMPELPDPFAFAQEESEIEDEEDIPDELPPVEIDPEKKDKKKKKHFADPTRKNKIKKFFSNLMTILILCGIGAGGFWYYQNVYLQTIDGLTIDGTQDEITVLIDTMVEESELIVTCSDSFGKVHTGSVQGGKVTFSGLIPSTMYTIEVDMEGFHKLAGKTTDVFTTGATTKILSFTSVAGSEDGSVILNFTVDGEEPDFWNIRYSAEGEDPIRETIKTHSTMITGLTVGKFYTFTIDGGDKFNVDGETTLQLLASKLILAENIVVTTSDGSEITVRWDTPGDVVVESWDVRCYDGYGFEEQLKVTENEALFRGIDPTQSYTVEITAAGMTQPVKTSISADPINIAGFHMDESKHTEMTVTWDYTGTEPEGGWLLVYTVDGSGKQIVKCEKEAAEIFPLIPGANYSFTLQSADSRSIFNNYVSYTTAKANPYAENGFNLENISIDLLKTPEEAEWLCEDIAEEAYTASFAPGDSVSIAMRSSSTFYIPSYKTKVLYVFRNAYGDVLTDLVSEETVTWKNIWAEGDIKNGELTVPKVPVNPGSYVLELYFNGCTVAEFDITITE